MARDLTLSANNRFTSPLPRAADATRWPLFRYRFCTRCCSAFQYFASSAKPRLCSECSTENVRRHVREWSAKRPLAGKAHSRVASAVLRGDLPPASECTCVDCGKPAECYDHRDYTKPLEVEPVCMSCNKFRGPGYPYIEAAALRDPRPEMRAVK